MNQLQRVQFLQSEELLSTKLTAPRLRAPLITRPMLLARLQEGVERKVTLISAPAGSGKTTLVSQWFAGCQEDGLCLPRAWIALDVGDNDPVRFGRYLVNACKTLDPNLGDAALALLAMQEPAIEAALTILINELAQLSERSILVLEDYHYIASPQVHAMVLFLLDHMPDNLHMMILTRHDPPLPLARLRARHELNELGVDELRFSLAETHTLLQNSLPLPVTGEAVERLYERTEGWVAALRLVVLALQGKGDARKIEEFVTNFSGGHGHILAYLVEEVLHAQPVPTQRFLLQTTFLHRLTGALCNAVTERNDSALLLEEMERANLFLVSLGHSPNGAQQWYRYHGLFAEAMCHHARLHLGEDEISELYVRATDWYEQHGLLGDALECTLANRNFERAALLLEQIVAPELVQNQFHNLRRWLQPLPTEVMQKHPQLALTYAISILFTSERFAPATHQLIEPPLQMAEEVWRAEGNAHKLGELLAFRSLVTWFKPNPAEAIAEAREALSLLAEENAQWRGISLVFVGYDEINQGRLHLAREELLLGLKLNEKAQNSYGILDTLLLLGRVSFELGELRQAAEYYQRVLAEVAQRPMARAQATFRKGRALAGLAALDLEWNRLESAEDFASQAVEISNDFREEELRVESAILLALTWHAQGRIADAHTSLLTLKARCQQPRFLRQVEAAQVRMALATGDSATLRGWQRSPQNLLLSTLQRQAEALLSARVELACSHAHEAMALLHEWQRSVGEDGHGNSRVEMLIITALAAYAQNNLARARQALCEAVELAHLQGYQRVFLDAGDDVADILRTLLRELQGDAVIAYVRSLLLAFATERSTTHSTTQLPAVDEAVLVEPLSGQERRILRLLAADLSYPEIAEELVISLNTVKTHVKNVYGKLGVHSRTEASEVAHQLQLL